MNRTKLQYILQFGRAINTRQVRFLTASAAAMSLVIAGPAAAEGCSNLHQWIDQNNAAALEIAQEYPGSTAVFASCMTMGASRYQGPDDTAGATGIFAGCAGLACLATDSYSDCVAANLKLFARLLQSIQLDQKVKLSGC